MCIAVGGGGGVCVVFFFFFKQKTAYEMCGHDWSSDVCSSDLDRQRSGHIAETFNLQYYNTDIHGAAFCLPTFIRTMLED